MKLVGANENPSSVGLEQMPHKTNYFKGSDESKWRTEIPNFRQIQINNVYQGIDAVWHGKENGGVQYDFVVKPNANPNQIEWKIEGAQSVELNGKGTGPFDQNRNTAQSVSKNHSHIRKQTASNKRSKAISALNKNRTTAIW